MKTRHFIGILLPLLGCSHGSPAENEAQMQKTLNKPIITNESPVPTQEMAVPNTIQKQAKQLQQQNTKALLNVPLIKQNPELKYGCEVTSLAMMLKYAGADTDKMKLFKEIKKENDALKRSANGDILSWGNPAVGFVGDMTGKQAGYAVFDKPIIDLINRYLPGRAVNLTGKEFDAVLDQVSAGYPAVVWTTGNYRLPDRWESWTHGNEVIKTPLDLHAVVLVGFNETTVYLNDPLSGRKQVPVNKTIFIKTWKAMQSRAVSYR
ncbi:C39 family peptidase [Mesobacillus subterraneus]|uniref:C39 family peptidase n=1 Tax=Mesobacillus subterraneus TaxID=285983 RepID=UPI001CFC7952|nr:C39 family peptidase [Mesobacillus subterraneus]WLR53671.1 C39 family peptidase [Mesobacillus subterraneus]